LANNLPQPPVTGDDSLAEILTMTNCAETARTPDEQRLVDVASILAAGILQLWDRQSLPVAKQAKKPGDSAAECLELSGETVLSVVHGG
jgi:hypothetical protein